MQKSKNLRFVNVKVAFCNLFEAKIVIQSCFGANTDNCSAIEVIVGALDRMYILLSSTHNRLSPSSIDTQDLGYETEMSLRYSSNTLHCFLKDKVDNFSVDTL